MYLAIKARKKEYREEQNDKDCKENKFAVL